MPIDYAEMAKEFGGIAELPTDKLTAPVTDYAEMAKGFGGSIQALTPEQASQQQPQAPQQGGGIWDTVKGIPSAIYEQVTGAQRSTPDMQTLEGVEAMPEMNRLLSVPAWKVALGTIFTNPEETIKIFRVNFPNNPIRQDEKGNYIIKSENGKEYALKPGFGKSDVGRVIAGGAVGAGTAAIAAPMAAGLGTMGLGALPATVLGTMGAEGLTQAAIEGTQALAGGEFNKDTIPWAMGVGGAFPAIGAGASKLKQPAISGLEVPRVGQEAMQAVGEAVMPNRPTPLKYGTGEVMKGPAKKSSIDEGMVEFTHSGGDITEIKKGGTFDGIFAAPGAESNYGVNGGTKQTSLFVKKENIAGPGERDLDYQKSIDFLKKKYPSADEDTIDDLYRITAEDKNVFDMDTNPLDQFGYDDLGEASWEAQRLRGQIAKDQGFDAIAMSDESGTSYLFPHGSKASINPKKTISKKAALTPDQIKSSQVMNPREPVDFEVLARRTPEQVQEYKDLVQKAANGNVHAQKRLADDLRLDPKVVQAANELGIIEHLQPDHMSTDFAFKELQQLSKSQKGSQLRDQEQLGLNAIGEKAVKMVKEFGATKDLGALSDTIKEGMTNSINKLKSQASAIYAGIAKKLPDGTQANLENTRAYFDGRISKLGSADKLPPVERKVYDQFFKDTEALNTYHFLDDQRQLVGADIGQFGKLNDKEKMLMGSLYDSMTKDQESTLSKLDPDLIDQWNSAKATVRLHKGIKDDMKSLFGKQTEKSLVDNLLSANTGLNKTDATKFMGMLKAIPKLYRQEFKTSALLHAFGKATENGKLNYTTFSNWFENISNSKQGKAALFADLPDGAARSIDNLGILSKSISSSIKKYAGTGASLQKYFDKPDTFLKNLLSEGTAGKGAASVAVGTAVSAVGGPVAGVVAGSSVGLAMAVQNALSKSKTPLMQRVDSLLASDAFKSFAVAATRDDGRIMKIVTDKLLKDSKFDAWAKAAKLPEGITARSKWIAKALTTEKEDKK